MMALRTMEGTGLPSQNSEILDHLKTVGSAAGGSRLTGVMPRAPH
jgi:hypothetical protein